MKKCPYCAEEIQDDAILCRWCGKSLYENSDGLRKARKKFIIIYVAILLLTWALAFYFISTAHIDPAYPVYEQALEFALMIVALVSRISAIVLFWWFSRWMDQKWWVTVIYIGLGIFASTIGLIGLLTAASNRLKHETDKV